MADIATIGSVLGSLKTAHELAKVIKSSSNSLEQAEVRFQIAELISALAEAKIELADIQSVIVEKDSRIKELESQLTERRRKVYDPPYYWLVDGTDRDGPFCQKCVDVDSLLVRLQDSKSAGFWRCKHCGNTFTDKNYVHKSPRVSY